MHGVKRQPKSATTSEAEAARKAKESSKLAAYLEIERTFFTHKSSSRKDQTALEHTTKLLTLNPELYTVWNYRREILLSLFASPIEQAAEGQKEDVFASLREPTQHTEGGEKKVDAVEEEEKKHRNRNLLEDDLTLTEHALRAHPKVYWIWNHRMWCLTQYPPPPAEGGGEGWVWERELKLVEKMLDYDPRNFHGWNGRRAIVQHLALSILSSHSSTSWSVVASQLSFPSLLSRPEIVGEEGGTKEILLKLAERELSYALRKIESNFSNFSAWHQRTQLLPHVWAAKNLGVKEVDAKLDAEFELVKQAIYTDPSDQSVWFYHRWLLDLLLSPPSPAEEKEEEKEGRKERRAKVIKEEIGVIEELLELEPESKWCAVSLAHLYTILAGLEGKEGGEKEGGWKGKAKGLLERLMELDPDREARYRDLLDGKAHF
ncbi:hypothetical protein NDA14_006962 [Ustilago hordei]|nr:hypothetical protein NDA14_006962 [Ustilago hordei]